MEAQLATQPPLDDLDGVFKSSRLIYRPIEETTDEKDFFYNNIWSDPRVSAYGTRWMLKPMSRQKLDEKFNTMIGAKCFLSCIICLPPVKTGDKPTPIGFVTVSDTSSELIRIGTVAFCIIPSYQSQGYGSEAMRWAIDWAFSFANLHRLDLSGYSFNTAAMHMYRRLGFVEEGRRREMVFFGNKYHDVIDMAMLRREWLAAKETPSTSPDSNLS